MAKRGDTESIGLMAASDLTRHRFTIMRLAGDMRMDVATNSAPTDFADASVGILDTPVNSGRMGSVVVQGQMKVLAAAPIPARSWFTANESGQAIVASSGDVVIGRAITARSADDVFFSAQIVEPFRLSGAN